MMRRGPAPKRAAAGTQFLLYDDATVCRMCTGRVMCGKTWAAITTAEMSRAWRRSASARERHPAICHAIWLLATGAHAHFGDRCSSLFGARRCLRSACDLPQADLHSCRGGRQGVVRLIPLYIEAKAHAALRIPMSEGFVICKDPRGGCVLVGVLRVLQVRPDMLSEAGCCPHISGPSCAAHSSPPGHCSRGCLGDQRECGCNNTQGNPFRNTPRNRLGV